MLPFVVLASFFFATPSLPAPRVMQETPAGPDDTTRLVTWHRDVAPLLRRHCADCHQPGGAAPFPLLTYQDAVKRKQFILDVTESGLMPPWKADHAYRSFANERLLPPADLALLQRWVAAGAPEGQRTPPPKLSSETFNDSGPVIPADPPDPPDLVLRMEKPFTIPAGLHSTYICVKIPYEIPRDTFVSATDFIPGNRKLAHHASYQILEVADDVDTRAGPEVEVYPSLTDENPRGGNVRDLSAGSLLKGPDDARQFEYFKLIGKDGTQPRLVFHTGWLPGTSPQRYPPGMGFRLPRKGVLLIRSLHYSPTPIDAEDQSTVRLWFARGPVERKVEFAAFKPEVALGNQKKPLMIPARKVVSFEINNIVPLDVSLLAVNPHMHLLGRSFKVYAVKPHPITGATDPGPRGDTIPLVNIPSWDFNWQEFYRFRTLIKLPKGSHLRAEAVFDNTSRNLSNPFTPPRDVYFERGMDDTDEMMRLVMLYVPWRPGDEEITQEK